MLWFEWVLTSGLSWCKLIDKTGKWRTGIHHRNVCLCSEMSNIRIYKGDSFSSILFFFWKWYIHLPLQGQWFFLLCRWHKTLHGWKIALSRSTDNHSLLSSPYILSLLHCTAQLIVIITIKVHQEPWGNDWWPAKLSTLKICSGGKQEAHIYSRHLPSHS